MWNEEKRIIESQLSPNERLLWSGRPRQEFFFRKSDALMIPFSLMWGGFAIFWETTVITTDAPLIFKLWGIPFVLVGLYMIFGRFMVDLWSRKKTFYGVTNERVMIVSGLFDESVKSLDLRGLTDMTLEQKTDGKGTITFGNANFPENSSGFSNWFGNNGFSRGRNQKPEPQFEQIENVRKIYEMIRSAQKQVS